MLLTAPYARYIINESNDSIYDKIRISCGSVAKDSAAEPGFKSLCNPYAQEQFRLDALPNTANNTCGSSRNWMQFAGWKFSIL